MKEGFLWCPNDAKIKGRFAGDIEHGQREIPGDVDLSETQQELRALVFCQRC